MKERRGLVRSEDILGEIRQSNFLQLGMTSSQDETILVWNAMRNYLCEYRALSYILAQWREVVEYVRRGRYDSSAESNKVDDIRRTAIDHVDHFVAQRQIRCIGEVASIYRTCSPADWSKRQNSGSYDVSSLTNRWTRVQSDFRVLFTRRKANSFSTSGQYCTCMGSNYCSTSISPI